MVVQVQVCEAAVLEIWCIVSIIVYALVELCMTIAAYICVFKQVGACRYERPTSKKNVMLLQAPLSTLQPVAVQSDMCSFSHVFMVLDCEFLVWPYNFSRTTSVAFCVCVYCGSTWSLQTQAGLSESNTMSTLLLGLDSIARLVVYDVLLYRRLSAFGFRISS